MPKRLSGSAGPSSITSPANRVWTRAKWLGSTNSVPSSLSCRGVVSATTSAVFRPSDLATSGGTSSVFDSPLTNSTFCSGPTRRRLALLGLPDSAEHARHHGRGSNNEKCCHRQRQTASSKSGCKHTVRSPECSSRPKRFRLARWRWKSKKQAAYATPERSAQNSSPGLLVFYAHRASFVHLSRATPS